jgi:MoaA/NifB/PqqE/SkfB family radical SAM enzyme
MPTGRLMHIDRKLLLTEKEREYLIRFHREANRQWRGPKVSVFAHTESPERFGCGAGTQHSYIDSQGNLCPCDFVPLIFGNIQERQVSEIWREMNTLIGKPRNTCFIHEIYPSIARESQGSLPLDSETSRDICRNCTKIKELPGFYTALKGDEKMQKMRRS